MRLLGFAFVLSLGAQPCWAAGGAIDAQLVDDALAQRLTALTDLVFTQTKLWYAQVTREGDNRSFLSLESAASIYCHESKESRVSTRWTAPTGRPGSWHDQIEFLWQDDTSGQRTRLTLEPPHPEVQTATCDGRARETPYLVSLGLGLPDRRPLTALLGADLRIADAQELRGHRCLVLRSAAVELWVCPDLDYAPLRLVAYIQPEQTTRSVYDWWGYEDRGGMVLPSWSLCRSQHRAGEGWALESMLLTRFDLIVVGEAAVQNAPIGWQVPLLGGAVVTSRVPLGGDRINRLGNNPHLALEVAKADGGPWGLSIKALAEDPELKLPEETDPPADGQP